MDRATLDAAYNNVRAIPDFGTVYADFQARSAQLYAKLPCQRDLAYGQHPRERYDWFPHANADAPVYVFIHGGYWQNCAKEDFAFIAAGPLARGFHVVLAEYALAPQASMTQIVAQIGALLDHLAADPHGLGIGKAALCLSGHSAGGHLTAMWRAHPRLSHALPISGLFDLEPIALSWLDEKLRLTPEEIVACSPSRRIGQGAPMTVAVGAGELPELVRQSGEYALACQAAGQTAHYLPLAGHTHFSVLEDLALPFGAQMQALCEAMDIQAAIATAMNSS